MMSPFSRASWSSSSALLLLFVLTLFTSGSTRVSAEIANLPCDCWEGSVSIEPSTTCKCYCGTSSEYVLPYCAFKATGTTKLNIVMDYTDKGNFSAGVTEIAFIQQIRTVYGSNWNGTFSFVIFEDVASNALARAYSNYPVVGRFLMDGDVAQTVLNGVNNNDAAWTTNLNVVTAYPFMQDAAPAEDLRGFAITASLHIYDIIWVLLILVICCCCCCECCCCFTNTERKAQEKANLLVQIPTIGVAEQPQQFPPGAIMPVAVIATAADNVAQFTPTEGEEQLHQQQKEQPAMIVDGAAEDHGVGEQQESAPPGMVV